jgi:hypothetical protein
MIAETSTVPSRAYLEELTVRMDTLCRFVEAQGNSSDFREEALSIADGMVKRALQVMNALRDCKGSVVSLHELRQTLSVMSLVSVVRDYDRALNDLQNAIGDEVHKHELWTQTPDSSGRDTLDSLEATHLELHNVMRELVGAVAV